MRPYRLERKVRQPFGRLNSRPLSITTTASGARATATRSSSSVHRSECIDCGGRCYLTTHAREDGRWYPGDIVTYKCRDCLDRWDLVMPDEEESDDDRL
ncbi:MAG: hypothetical protein EBX99_07960 [Acidimicrobiia bacterium]|nr:hypothetical protein [Acidimicrobiia bacterium]